MQHCPVNMHRRPNVKQLIRAQERTEKYMLLGVKTGASVPRSSPKGPCSSMAAVVSAYRVNSSVHCCNGGVSVSFDAPHCQNLVCWAGPFLHKHPLLALSTSPKSSHTMATCASSLMHMYRTTSALEQCFQVWDHQGMTADNCTKSKLCESLCCAW